MSLGEPAQIEVKNGLREARVVLACLLSAGLYIFYWFYLSWKQLRDETGRNYYPVWHAIALGVPLYNLYMTYVHIRTIQDLQVEAGVNTTLRPAQAVGLMLLANVLWFQVYRVGPAMGLLLDFLGVVAFTFLLAWAQSNLNWYWGQKYGERLKEAPIGAGEVFIVFLGMLSWATSFLALVLPAPGG